MLLVYGPRSPTYDFGPGHPLTPRRFGPCDRPAALARAPSPASRRSPRPMTSSRGAMTRATSRSFGGSRTAPFGGPLAGIGEGDDPPFAGHARRGSGGRRGLDPRDRGDPARRRRPCLPPGRWPAPCDAGPRVGVLHLRRPGAGDRPGAARRAARPVHRPRRPPRRRRPGDLLRRSGRADGLDPRVRPVPVPGQRVRRRGRRGGGGRDLGQRPAGADDRRGGVARGGADAAPRTGRRVRAGHRRSASTAPIRTRGTRSRTCG